MYGVDDDEIFGGINSCQLYNIVNEVVTLTSLSQRLEIEKIVIFYLISKEVWKRVKQSAEDNCAMCDFLESGEAYTYHSCTYLQALCFVTPPHQLKALIENSYDEARNIVNWNKLWLECSKFSMHEETMKCRTDSYWKTRSRSVMLDINIKIYLFEMARHEGYFTAVLKILPLIG